MKKRTVISKENLPYRMPIHASILYPLAMDYWGAPQWLWGIIIFLLVLIWFWYFAVDQESVDIFDNNSKENTPSKSRFQQKLEEMSKKRN